MSKGPDDSESGDEPGEPKSGKPAKAAKAAKPPKPPKEKKAKGKGGFNPVLILVPIALIAAAVLAFALPPTHAMLANGPLKPLLARFSHAPAAGAAAKAVDPVADNKRLAAAVAADKAAAAAKDAQIAQLQSHVTQLEAPSPSPSPGAASAKPTPAVVSDDVKRAATYWAAMDADKAAEIVKQLPDAYVESVFSQMPADSVSDILSELPAKTAARLTQGAAPSP